MSVSVNVVLVETSGFHAVCMNMTPLWDVVPCSQYGTTLQKISS
jgi:hypothetical protein